MKTNWMALIFALLLGGVGLLTLVGTFTFSRSSNTEQDIYYQLLYLTGSLWLIGGAFMLERVTK